MKFKVGQLVKIDRYGDEYTITKSGSWGVVKGKAKSYDLLDEVSVDFKYVTGNGRCETFPISEEHLEEFTKLDHYLLGDSVDEV